MESSGSRPTEHFRHWSSSSHAGSYRGGHPLYRQDSNMSSTSFVSEVEMAHDEVFAGPISESVPSATTGFANRRDRTGSTASFTYYPDEDVSPDELVWPDHDDAVTVTETEDLDEPFADSVDADIETGKKSFSRRKSSGLSRISVEDPLLARSSSQIASGYLEGDRTTQKIYIAIEDLTVVFAGFKTSGLGYSLYLCLCLLTAGLGYLVLKWMPRWKVRLIGVPTALRACHWVVVENQWGEFTIHMVKTQEYGHPISTVFGSAGKAEQTEIEEDEDPGVNSLRSLDYRYIRFMYHPLQDKFVLGGNFKDPSWTDIVSVKVGLDEEMRLQKEKVFGKNAIDIEEKSVPALLVDEAFHPFYVFQIASLILWSLDEYYYYATCIFLISVVSITTTLIDTRATMKRLREISRFECDVRVLRDGFWMSIPSTNLAPGDIYELSDPALSQFPCDSLLLAGDCIVNESMLTGESVPVSKVAATDETLELLDLSTSAIHADMAKYFLFSGTKTVRARRPQADEGDEAVALGMVVRIGFNTTKGALVRSMLFPKPSGFKFYQDSFRYISVMASVAGIGFVASFVNFIRLHLAWHLILVRALDLITIVVPPALPATLTIGTNFALSRLRKKQIYCISPQRVNVGGKLDIMCFDKTGTLTEDGLDVLGLRIVHRPAMRFSELYTDYLSVLPGTSYERDPSMDYSVHKAALYSMATCHSLKLIDGHLLGDPLDFKMFDFTGWSFEEGGQKKNSGNIDGRLNMDHSIARPPPELEYDLDPEYDQSARIPVELNILRSFEFVSQLRRASVVVRQSGAQSGDIYVKGAPECMRDICRSESFPMDFEELLSYYTHRGYRVIACATRHVAKLSWAKAQKLERWEVESNLDFIGFIIFENKLKETTTGIIDELNEANIRSVMCTGDNILTAISVARECHLMHRTAHCFVPHFSQGDVFDPKAELEWHSVDNSIFELDRQTLQPLPPPAEGDISLPYEMTNFRNYSIAVTGDVFRWIVEFAPPEVLKRILAVGQVFARMSPDEKHELVEKFKSIDYCAGFCGDGANDCGALKAADVGISLSEAEASVAAPFTSRVFDISCVPEVIREGRAALVTSFCCFKYMSLYSAIQFTSVSFLYASASNLGDFQFLFIDLALILPIAIFMGWTAAYPVLSRKRPTASLVSRKVLVPLIGQILLCIIIQAIGFKLVQRQPWYIPPKLSTERSSVLNSQNTTLFLLSTFQYILSSIVLSIGPPFRQPISHNLPFVITIAITTFFSLYMLLDPAEGFAKFMQLTYLSWTFKVIIVLLACAGFLAQWSGERVGFVWLAKGIGRWREGFRRGRGAEGKKRKQWKVVREEMRV